MLCVILAAGVGNSLEKELQADAQLRGIPRALLPVGGRPMLSYWWDSITTTREISHVYLVCNASHYKHFERWATANGLPVCNVVNNGATSRENSLGAAKDLQLAIRRAKSDGVSTREACVIAGDSLFFKEFDLQQVFFSYRRLQVRDGCSSPRTNSFNGESELLNSKTSVSLILYYKLSENEDPGNRGMVDIDQHSKRVIGFHEKPRSTKLTLAAPLFYILGPLALDLLESFTQREGGQDDFSCGRFLEATYEDTSYFGVRLPGGFNLVGVSAGLEEYRELNETFLGGKVLDDSQSLSSGQFRALPQSSYGKAYARVGLLGNPSDGFHGKTLSLTIKNFLAEVWMEESEKLCIRPHPLFDPSEFGSLNDLYSIAVREGYHGGYRLVMGTCKKFFEFCVENQIALPKRNFTVSYDTNIPRQVGLSGSSAIVTALLRALMCFYGLTEDDIPKPLQPKFVLSVESEELGITAGLQDRVVQCYEGLVYMDFSKDHMERLGHGIYTKIPVVKNLPFFIAYRADPSDSGKIHSDVKQRWLNGDQEVTECMERFAAIAEEGFRVLQDGDKERFGELMDANFALRRDLYGDLVVGEANIEMAELAKQHGAYCKFPGSGGAVLGLAKSRGDFEKLRDAYEGIGCVFSVLEPAE
mmetsp:Transcript_7178/g.11439  ORF Transcript_7178/g.11439 Transcript_7178/m.11439 type:complete len:644 (+) Transcript_7178:323-2254(+)